MVAKEMMRTQVDNRDCKGCLLGWFYECVFCHMDQSSAAFTNGPGKPGVFVGGRSSRL